MPKTNRRVVAPKDKLLPKLTTAFFNRPRLTAMLWLVIFVFGLLSYTVLLRREGFPSVNIPLNIVSGTYIGHDGAEIDSKLAKPITDIALKQKDVSNILSQSADNFFSVQIQYAESVDATAASHSLEQQVKQAGLPAGSNIKYNVPYFGATGGDTEQIDAAISFYKQDGSANTQALDSKANEAASWLNAQKLSLVSNVFVKHPFQTNKDPVTGETTTAQRTFDRYTKRQNNATKDYDSVIIGISRVKGSDVIKLDKQINAALVTLRQQPNFKGYGMEVSASFAPNIKDNLSELQRVLLEGLLAILVVGSIVIAVRASFITIISMITVLLTSLGFLYLIGYTLNVITLFALILGLALIVDDTIIMVEAIDAARRRDATPRQAVGDATRKVSRAMVAATLTASLSFAPLIFVGGILGSFIRAIPITLISSLIISLLVALVFIPFFARFILLGKKQMGKMAEREVAAGFEKRLAEFVAKPMLWARHSRKKLFGVGITAVLAGLIFIASGLFIGKSVIFNIFPPTKDTNGIAYTLNFPNGTTIEKAQNIAADADALAAKIIGENYVQGSYYSSGSAQSALMQIQITPYGQRAIHSPQIVADLQKQFDDSFKEAKVTVAQTDLGPPSSAFTIQLESTNRTEAFKVGESIASFLKTDELKRLSGKKAHFKNINVSSPDEFVRAKGKPIIQITANFDGDDTSTLVTLAQDSVKKEFPPSRLQSLGLKRDALGFDLGQETENQNSFKTLALAFPILLIAMFILLAVQFRSLLQPLLIFMAIPFSIFGVMFGLKVTNNPISFFAMLGFFALVGLSIKNTILLTDFANQARKSGLGPVDSAVAALEERFRPLIATSLTAVVSIIPLAISSPFWQGLAVVLIFGLLSSTLLVITVFPYYYLGAEYLRLTFTAKQFFKWLIPTVVLVVLVSKLAGPSLGMLVLPISLLAVISNRFYRRRLAQIK